MRIGFLVSLLALVLTACTVSAGAFEEVSGAGAPDACNELRAAFCDKGAACIDGFNEEACATDLAINGVDCEDAERVRADIDGCVAALADASCEEAVDGTTILFVGPCEDITVE